MRFDSKRDAWIIVIALLSPLLVLVIVANQWIVSRHEVRGPMVGAVIVVFAVVVLVWWMFRTTYYVIDGDTLVIRAGLLTWRIPIRDIKAVAPTRNPLSSPALSLDRLRIDYGSSFIMVSPVDKERFIDALRAVNPAIMRRE